MFATKSWVGSVNIPTTFRPINFFHFSKFSSSENFDHSSINISRTMCPNMSIWAPLERWLQMLHFTRKIFKKYFVRVELERRKPSRFSLKIHFWPNLYSKIKRCLSSGVPLERYWLWLLNKKIKQHLHRKLAKIKKFGKNVKNFVEFLYENACE